MPRADEAREPGASPRASPWHEEGGGGVPLLPLHAFEEQHPAVVAAREAPGRSFWIATFL
jgi:hypothetical protein